MRRKVQYWRAFNDDDTVPANDVSRKIIATLEHAKTKGLDRKWTCRNGMTVLGHPANTASTQLLILDKVRSANYPSAGDQQGNRVPLPLRSGQVLLEPTYAMFLNDGIIAVLMGTDGPHPQRLVEYLRAKLGIDWRIEPVLRDDLDKVLAEMRITGLEIAIPAESITRELVGGDFYGALESASQLTDDGIVRIGLSVGRKGDANFKQRMSEKYRSLVGSLRSGLGLSNFHTAKARGVSRGDQRVVDLLEDRLVQSVEVEDSLWFDPQRSAAHAGEILARRVTESPFADLVPQDSGAGDVELLSFEERTSYDDAAD